VTAPAPAVAPARPDAVAVARLAALLMGTVVLVVVGYLVAVRTTRGQRLDDAALLGRNVATPRAVHVARLAIGTVSVTSLAIAVIVLVIVAFGRGRPRLALVVGAATVGANVTSEVLKHNVLTRPILLVHAPIAFNTYPSGHSTVAMSVSVAAMLVVSRRWRGTVAIVGLSYAIAVGGGTMVVGWHRPSDVIAGFAVAIGWGAAAALVLIVWRGDRRAPPDDDAEVPLPGLLAVAGVGLVVLAGAVLVGAVGRSAELFELRRGRAFIAASLAIVAVGALLVAALLAPLRNVTLDPPPRVRQ
jgi:membrane-associated phospholipid phosphatase